MDPNADADLVSNKRSEYAPKQWRDLVVDAAATKWHALMRRLYSKTGCLAPLRVLLTDPWRTAEKLHHRSRLRDPVRKARCAAT